MFGQSYETYDLKLDQACIFLRQGTPSCVSGVFHVNLPQKSSFKGIRVKLVGTLKIPRDGYLIQNDRQVTTSSSEQSIGTSKTLNSFQLPAGNYEFPFNIPITGRMLDTVTGECHMYHSYHVQATIERRFRGDSIISRPIRIHRYPYLSSEPEISFIPTTIERQSNREIQYCMSIPDSNIPFGSKFSVNCHFSPLTKGLSLKNVSVSVSEKHALQVDATAAESAMHGILRITSTRNTTIFDSEHEINDQTSDTSTTTDDIGDDSPAAEWDLNFLVQLPESLSAASQSISTNVIKIAHHVVIKAQFHNAETNTPITIEEEIPFSIYMTPAVIYNDGSVHGQDLECFQTYEVAPPAYGQHKCDAIPAELTGYINQANNQRLRVSDQLEQCDLVPSYQQVLPASNNVRCVPIAGDSMENDPPAYQFCLT